ncbi:hypothetical protein [Noviherbaspirillum aridicola]|uniref:Uncharacterized protein n=1 Tax=Noviherbaspirillum aridicola TaxID=2849687 RepID=A0ABQ4Q6G6_9BURK|nr:hypothetical protein [Noviherbaspirillum aridicola]GIZ52808.1 hypothetical protein NCCP691_28220 [Noviherbaspirillum aridicola]
MKPCCRPGDYVAATAIAAAPAGTGQRVGDPVQAAAGAWAAVLVALCRIGPGDDEEGLLAEAERRRGCYRQACSLAADARLRNRSAPSP